MPLIGQSRCTCPGHSARTPRVSASSAPLRSRLAPFGYCIYGIYMLAKIFKTGNSLALRLPKELGATEGEVVEIDAQGDRWVVRPAKPNAWPRGFFSRIRLSDASRLERPSQGEHREVEL